MPTTSKTDRPQRNAFPRWSDDLVAVGAAVLCALVTWFVTGYLANLELTVQRGSEIQRVTGLSVALVAGICALAAYVVLWALERATVWALRIWTVLAVVVTLISLLGPMAATSPAAKGTLIALHTVVAAAVIASAHRSRRRRRPADDSCSADEIG